ncbi:MAG: tetratricopeptide repeat protein, partial [Bacillota bacterium]
MKSRLNFNRLLFTSILAFVSLQNAAKAASSTSGQEQDDFAIFEEKPTTKIKSVEKPMEKSPSPVKESAEQKIDRLKIEIRKNPRNVALIVQLAEVFYQQKEYDKTTALLWKQIDKIDRPAILLLARAHEAQKQPNDMIRALNNLVGKDEKDYEAYTLLGNAYSIQKKYSEALESYKKSLDANAKYEPAYQSLLTMYEKRTPPNLYEMRILVQDMIDNIGNRPEYLARLCEINFNDSTFEAAIDTCKQAIAKDSKSANSY